MDLASRTGHFHDPKQVCYGPAEFIICLVQEAHPYVRFFVKHNLALLSAKHLVFLDKGSTDGMAIAARSYENVKVLQTGLPFRASARVRIQEKLARNLDSRYEVPGEQLSQGTSRIELLEKWNQNLESQIWDMKGLRFWRLLNKLGHLQARALGRGR